MLENRVDSLLTNRYSVNAMGTTPRHPHFNHKLPLWIDPNSATFFITITAQKRGVNHFCKPGIGTDALDAARKYHNDQRWFCWIIVLMPDHVHMLVTMAPDRDLAKTVGMWKRWLWKKRGIEWQPIFLSGDYGLAKESIKRVSMSSRTRFGQV